MRTLFAAAAIGLAGMGVAWAQDMTPQDFVDKAASGGMFEIQSSQLALERSQKADIQAFAQLMIKDHTANSEELAAAAKDQNLTVPTEITGESAKQMQAVQDAQGDGFDAVYTEQQVAAHEATINLYQGYADSGDNEALVAYAKKSLPVLQQHLEHAQALTGH